MPETQKREEESEKIESQKPETGDETSWSEDQKKRGYYYDDACGYEVYHDEEEDEDEANLNTFSAKQNLIRRSLKILFAQ